MMGDEPCVSQHSNVVSLLKKAFFPHSVLLVCFYGAKYLVSSFASEIGGNINAVF